MPASDSISAAEAVTPVAAAPAPLTADGFVALTDLQATAPTAQPPGRLPFPVVGIGASAGGVEVVRQLFKTMPVDTGCAFVIVMHLAPDRPSMLDALVARCTSMPVQQVEGESPVQPNHVYITSPGNYLLLEGGRLRVEPIKTRPPKSVAIDRFLVTLAAHQADLAVGVVLSGADGDGSIGLKAIKSEGGLTLVQLPGTAAHPDMPRSAIATGAVDRQLLIDDIPTAIVDYFAHANPASVAAQPDAIAADSEAALARILDHTRRHFSLDLRGYRKPMLLRRVRRRMGLSRVTTMQAYAERLANDVAEATALRDDFLINVTEFFREPESWIALQELALPQLLAAKAEGEPLRVWVPACSTGEEAYSLAMLLLERPELTALNLKLQIFGTDVDLQALEVARRGRYPSSIEHAVSRERLRRYFTPVDGQYQVRKALREMVMFAPQNVASDPPFSHIDLVSCRNLLIYMEPALQMQVLQCFHFALEPHGVLALGRSESAGPAMGLFTPVADHHRLFRRVGSPRQARAAAPGTPAQPVARRLGKEPAAKPEGDYADLIRDAIGGEQPAVLIHRDGRALFVQGNVHPYLGPPEGAMTQDVFAMVHDDLRPWLRVAVHRAGQQKSLVRTHACLGDGAEAQGVTVSVQPLGEAGADALMVVSFEAAAEAPTVAALHADGNPEALRALDDELRRTRAELRGVIEQLESANEEMTVANEEAMSTNEELQSSNEELETSNEELESVNEEMTTVNAQLQEKVSELEATTNDLDNLINSTFVPTLFLDREMRIQRYTPAANQLFSLRPSDVNRPLSDLTSRVDHAALLEDVRGVIGDLAMRERELTTADDQHYLCRTLPYRTKDDRIEGVVVTFYEVTELKRSAESLRRYAVVLQGSEDSIIVHALDGTVLTWNRGAERLYGVEAEEALGSDIAHRLPESVRPEQAERVKGLLAGRRVRAEPSQRHRRDGSLIDVSVSMSLVHGSDDQPVAVALIERDVTAQRRAADQLRESEQRFRGLSDSAPVLIWLCDAHGQLQFVNEEFADFVGLAAAAAVERPWPGLLHADDQAAARAALAGGAARFETQARLMHAQGSYRWVRVSGRRQGGEASGWIGSMIDIDQQVRAEAELRAAAQRKDEFLAMLGHELRNPLAPIRNAAEVLRRIGGNDDRITWVRDTLVRQVDHVTRLVDDLLDISLVTRGALNLHLEPVDVSHAVARAIEATAPIVRRKQHRLDSTLATEPMWVEADAIRLTQIFENLITNAAKYTDERGKLVLSLAREGNEAVFKLRDNGIGIAPEVSARIFELFVQDERSVDRSQGGMGIGLALVRHLVHLHRGSVEAHSEGRGKGSEFVVRLPVVTPADHALSPPVVEAGHGHGRVLIVDDDIDGGQSLSMLLELDGYDVALATGLASALEQARILRPQVVVMDVAMPEADGYEVARRLRQLPQVDAKVAFVALKGFGQSSDALRSEREGFAGHLVKPVDPNRLGHLLRELLAR